MEWQASGKEVDGLEVEELKAQLEEWARADPKEAPEFPRRKQWDQSEFGFDIPVCDCKNMPELKEAGEILEGKPKEIQMRIDRTRRAALLPRS